ncbi:hypothetical protein RSOL_432540 [Rhizoctonia solani AG-3 Rhs1AP]|uniref:Uncharacterized protein n=1 Tax=Rhizoctonia solani AG-3 Rhs1AP TaxID=1086054 RepID=X8JJR0_9AGAM|nr:hypothetical protein RSOL_432540 [Rhizoctonia solani AG-3 Rhs1AP]
MSQSWSLPPPSPNTVSSSLSLSPSSFSQASLTDAALIFSPHDCISRFSSSCLCIMLSHGL